MDKLEEKIIQELTKDARKPFSTIAKKLGVSTQTIMRRYNEMKTNGIIALSAITINLEKIGYKGTAHLLIKTKKGADSTRTVEQLSKTPNVITATRTIGAYEAYAVLAFRTINDLYENASKIKELPDVQTIDLSFALPGIQYFPPPENRVA
jgi:Lrp/AsnC family transcriptional regulator for asnA, asnC and gidA